MSKNSEIIALLLQQGLIDAEQVAIYNLFGNAATIKHLEEVRTHMFMKHPIGFDAQSLAHAEGARNFVRHIFETIDTVNYKIKTGGTECPSYLHPPTH